MDIGNSKNYLGMGDVADNSAKKASLHGTLLDGVI